MAKQPPTSEPVPDDDVPERIVADPEQQEFGHSDWSGLATGGVVDGPVLSLAAGCVIGER